MKFKVGLKENMLPSPGLMGGKATAPMSSSHVSPALSELLPILVPSLSTTAANAPGKTLTQGDPVLLAELRQDGLTPLIYMQLLSQGLTGGLNPTFLAALQHDYYCSVQAAARQEQEALRVFQDLNKAGVEFILLKGADLRLRVYQDPAQRPMVDLDLLISRQQLPLAQEVLGRLGYRVPPLHADLHPGCRELFQYMLTLKPPPPGGLEIDLHWEIRAVAGFYRLPFAALRLRATSMDYQGVPVKLLSPEHLLIHLCLHMYSDQTYSNLYGPDRTYFSSRQVVDLAFSLARLPLNWPQFLKDVAHLHCQTPLLAVLTELHTFLPGIVKPLVLVVLARHRPKAPERIAFYHRLGRLTVPFVMFYHEPLQRCLRYLAAKLWPDPEYLLQTLGTTSRRLYLKRFLNRFRSGPNRTV